jgi:hypothetical protein
LPAPPAGYRIKNMAPLERVREAPERIVRVTSRERSEQERLQLTHDLREGVVIGDELFV